MSDKTINTLLVAGMDVIVGLVGFGISCAWWKRSGRSLDRDSIRFLMKLWIGISAFGIALIFLM